MILWLFSLYREVDFSVYGVAPDFPLGRTPTRPSGGREVWRVGFEAVFAKQASAFTQQDHNFSSLGEEPLGGCQFHSHHQRRSGSPRPCFP